jgi:steroid delta-isomerase-like uncharacterized protein
MNTDTRTIVIEWTDAINKHDPDAALEFVSDQCEFTNIGTGRHSTGRTAVREEYAGLFARWSDLHIDITNLFVANGQFAKEWIMTGVHTGDLPGLPATGRPFRLRGVGIGEVRNGKLDSQTEYWNMADFLAQVRNAPHAER